MIDSKRGTLDKGGLLRIPHGVKYPQAKTQAVTWYWQLLG